MSLSNIRKNAIVGIIEESGLAEDHSLHFSEWWNGEGLDLHFDQETRREARISLSITQLKMLAVAAHAAGFLDLDEVVDNATELLASSRTRDRKTQEFRDNYQE